MKKVLILTAAYGEGHNAAARGLFAGCELAGGIEARVVDSFADGMGAAYEKSRQGYLRLIDRWPLVWAGVYGVLDRTPLIYFTLPFLRQVQAALARCLAEFQPDAIVSTYPVYSYLLARLRTRTPRFSVVTDSITVNSVWHRCGSDLYFVPNEDTARVMRAAGVPEKKLRVLGFPVPPRFAHPPEARPTPGQGEPLRVLFMINAAKDRAPGLTRRLLQIDGLQLTVTAGRDEALKAALEAVGRESGKPLEVHGWTPNMPELLMRSHLLIGKAGGAAVQETTAARTPMIVTQVVPGQEEGNARLLVENGCGAVCPTTEGIAVKIQELLANDAQGWKQWEANITKLSRPEAALQIARETVKAIESK